MVHRLKITSSDTAIPAELLEAAGLRAGDEAVAETTPEGVLIRRAGLRERVDADVAAGRPSEFDSDEEFRASVVSRMHPGA